MAVDVRILLTNDDGIRARGLDLLRRALAPFAEVWVVAPDREQSACSHALSLNDPVRVHRIEDRVFALTGTPTDCVLFAIRGIDGVLDPHPQMVIAGINHGPNLGDDVTYSGTVAAAMEGAMLGLPAIAFSNTSWRPQQMEASAEVAARIVQGLLGRELPSRLLLNVNFPDVPVSEMLGLRATRLGKRVYRDVVVAEKDPRARPYYWIGGDPPVWESDPDSDFEAIDSACVSVTPLLTDWTAHSSIETVARLAEELEGAVLPRR
jgi:5'-nucleotidase